MSFIKTPMKGMPEQLPLDMQIREYVTNKIKESYAKYGFSLIETPIVEHIENLSNKQGGENEKLIFKILKRGEKLDEANSTTDMVDAGLRYDLTVPLARFYANNANNLPVPFKAFQMGSVFRADRPQKGRYRQFTQCDLDIIGDSSNLAEIELISVISDMLYKLGLGNFKIRVNDRRILKGMAKACNFPEELYDEIFIALDKLDKIGISAVSECLKQLGLNEQDINNYCKAFSSYQEESSCLNFVNSNFAQKLDDEVVNNLETIIKVTSKIADGKGRVIFDPSLVRGMSYYTGPIFEVELSTYHLSIGGGGRYDEMIGKYSGNNVCACGFSLGFERLIEIIKENNLAKFNNQKSTAILIAKDVPYTKIQNVMEYANDLRDKGERVLIAPRNKNAKFQKEKLEEIGYTDFVDVYPDSENF